MLAQGVVAIPGTKRRLTLEANVAAACIRFSAAERAELDAILPVGNAVGAAYPSFLVLLQTTIFQHLIASKQALLMLARGSAIRLTRT